MRVVQTNILIFVGMMTKRSNYDPAIHHRRSIRLKGYDYSSPGRYFITLCCKDMQRRFGEVIDGEMQLNAFGRVAQWALEELPRRLRATYIFSSVVMPNHVHFIVTLHPDEDEDAPTIFTVVQRYKTLVTNQCVALANECGEILGGLWQRNYYEHIIRDDAEHEMIRAYVNDNPARWRRDCFFTGE